MRFLGKSETELEVTLRLSARGRAEITRSGTLQDHPKSKYSGITPSTELSLRDITIEPWALLGISPRLNNRALGTSRRRPETQQPSPSTSILSTVNPRPQLKRLK